MHSRQKGSKDSLHQLINSYPSFTFSNYNIKDVEKVRQKGNYHQLTCTDVLSTCLCSSHFLHNTPLRISTIIISILFIFSIYFYQLEANYFTTLQWVLSYIDMNQPWSHMCSPSRSPLPPPFPPNSSGTSQCTILPQFYRQENLVTKTQKKSCSRSSASKLVN